MNLTDKIKELQIEHDKQIAIEDEAHNKAVEIKRKIGRLQTAIKHAEAIINETGETEPKGE